jgi:hypothetical protein
MDMVTLAVIGIIGYVFAILGLVAFVRLGKINKNLKRKSNFGRGLQRRVMHQTNLLSRLVLTRLIN